MLVKLTTKQFPSPVCCYMCAFAHIQYGLIHQADFESRSGSLALGNGPTLAAYCAT